jgi:uncharacterized protein
MAYPTDPRLARARFGAAEAYDEGLRSYLLAVFNYMGVGLAITGVVAFIVGTTPALYGPILFSPLRWVVIFAPLLFVFFMSARMSSMSVSGAQIAFWLFSAVMGLSLSSIFLVFAHQSIARVFFITAATFGATALWGYTTKRDLTQMGSFMFMGLIGIVIAGVVNIFLASSAVQFAISVIGVVVFTGLTAWDMQRIRDSYYALGGGEMVAKGAIMGALTLYLDFINLFMSLLQLFGDRRG